MKGKKEVERNQPVHEKLMIWSQSLINGPFEPCFLFRLRDDTSKLEKRPCSGTGGWGLSQENPAKFPEAPKNSLG